MVRKAMGSFIFCQQPKQKIGCDAISEAPESPCAVFSRWRA
jgi:hypothetical protein